MAMITKFLIALLFFSLLVLQLAEADHDTVVSSNLAASSPPTKIDCGSACEARCQLSSRPRLCKRACGTCCSRCSCVPPGTAAMAIFKILAAVLLVGIVFNLAVSDMVIKSLVESDPAPQIDCASACAVRCQLSSRPNLCHRACGTCCDRCNCVPPGTSGNYDVCPCYGNMTTHHGQHKCP
ncbi:hypothetical protein NC652_014886 [Populus alba x Populus x berolinensis]|nr:hypothetical protein NC652_014886 [Populus alba x Populus x berolinensis]